MDYAIREMSQRDWEQVKSIYEDGILTGNSTIEKAAPSWGKWDAGHIKSCRIVAIFENTVIGWVVLSPVSSRCAYAGVAEISLYIAPKHWGKGVGTMLLKKMISCSEENGFWTLHSGIFPENTASLALHKKCGFREIGRQEKVGRMPDGTWRDVVLMERRSQIVGID